jgi:hypothetical protein
MKRSEIPDNAPINQITDWPSFFDQVRLRPGMWLGEPSLTALQHLINGFEFAAYLYDVPDDRRLRGFAFSEFEAWAEQQFNPNRLSLNSYSLARRSSESEEEAFFKWFGWYDRFRSERTTG